MPLLPLVAISPPSGEKRNKNSIEAVLYKRILKKLKFKYAMRQKQKKVDWNDIENSLLYTLEIPQTWNGGTMSAKEQHCASSGIFRNSAFIFLSLKFTNIPLPPRNTILWLFKITPHRKYQKLPNKSEYIPC